MINNNLPLCSALFFLIFRFILITNPYVTAQKRLCSGKGYPDSHGVCVCMSDFHGQNCEYRYCPFGPSWLGKPFENDKRNMSLVPCSDMGYCNILTGECECRSGFEGRACERMACPTTVGTVNYTQQITTSTNIDNTTYNIPIGRNYGTICSGHGICRTLREVSNGFDGLKMIRPPVNYNNWDADRIQGCLCDDGWEGYDCSRIACPKGRDPTDPSTKYSKEELFILECQASSGYFSILALGYNTDPIPFDADPAYLKYVLESLPTVGKVTVSTGKGDDLLPEVCGSNSVVTTYIRFESHLGDRPPIFINLNTSNTRAWPSGSTKLRLNNGGPIIRMRTEHRLKCPSSATLSTGKVYFSYKSSFSVGVDVTATNATGLIKQAILGLYDLRQMGWSNLGVSVKYSGSTDKICNTGADTTFYINLYSDYGNIPYLNILDASSAELIFGDNKGNGTLYECSNQGYCDATTGACLCFSRMIAGEYVYNAVSGDGKGGLGLRGDCGHMNPPLTTCTISDLDSCSARGICDNATHTCECYDGWYSVVCTLRQCPHGPAFFDEPILNNTAHQMAECSNSGSCNRQGGFCACRPGFSGTACQIRDCARDAIGTACSGTGLCVSISQYYQLHGYSYGNVSNNYLDGGSSTWDAFNWYECLCYTHANTGLKRLPSYHPVGPSTIVSGTVATAQPIQGWSNWDCSKRNCPRGHDSRFGYTSQLEIQKVLCTANHFTNSSFYFVLNVFGEDTARIYGNFNAWQIKAAIEYTSSVGNVSVWFPNYQYDGVQAACNATVNSTSGGFFVQFDTEFGDLPLMRVKLNSKYVRVMQYQKGVNTNAECSGTSLGYCDRGTGSCICNHRRYSSDGKNGAGISGDCSYFDPSPRKSDSINIFNGGES